MQLPIMRSVSGMTPSRLLPSSSVTRLLLITGTHVCPSFAAAALHSSACRKQDHQDQNQELEAHGYEESFSHLNYVPKLPTLERPSKPWVGDQRDRWLTPWELKRKEAFGNDWREKLSTDNLRRTAALYRIARRAEANKLKRTYEVDYEVVADFMWSMREECTKVVKQGKALMVLANRAILGYLRDHGSSSIEDRVLRRHVRKNSRNITAEDRRQKQLVFLSQKTHKLIKDGHVLKLGTEIAILGSLHAFRTPPDKEQSWEKLEQILVGRLAQRYGDEAKTKQTARQILKLSTALVQSISEQVSEKFGAALLDSQRRTYSIQDILRQKK